MEVKIEVVGENPHAAGIIPSFLLPHKTGTKVRDTLESGYGFPLYPLGDQIWEDGYHYPEDEPMEVQVRLTMEGTTAYVNVYPYGIVAIFEEDSSVFITRMD